MFFYLVEKIGDGTRDNPFRPDFQGEFVWSPEHVCPDCETYIIGLPEQTESLTPVTNLESACNARGLSIEDVRAWFVGD